MFKRHPSPQPSRSYRSRPGCGLELFARTTPEIEKLLYRRYRRPKARNEFSGTGREAA
jgi:hypothetical protein